MDLNSKPDLAVLRAKLSQALDGLVDGVSFHVGTIRYEGDGSGATIRIDASRIGETGVAETPERRDFSRFALLYGLRKDDLDREFDHPSLGLLKIVGSKPRARKYPILVSVVDGDPEKIGKTFKLPSREAKVFLDRVRDPETGKEPERASERAMRLSEGKAKGKAKGKGRKAS